jgi:chromosome partitioning protein
MSVISIAGSKGGVGKTTVAYCLATEWHLRGHKVLLADADPQLSAMRWAERLGEGASSFPVIAVGDRAHVDIAHMSEHYDIVIVDTAGRKSSRLVGALSCSDLAIFPSLPSPMDVWAMAATIEVFHEVQAMVHNLQGRILLNGAQRTALSAGAAEALAETELPLLRSSLRRLVAYSEAPTAGLGVTAYAPGSEAAQEIRAVTDELESILSGEQNVEEVLHAAG